MRTLNLKLMLLIVAFVFLANLAFAAESPLKIADMSGKVMVMVSPSKEWTDAKVGDILNVNDAVKTGEDGKAALEFPDKTSLILKPQTEIAVEELVWEEAAKKVGLKMTSGSLRTLINTPSEFKIKTPTAICGARGTLFYIFIQGTDTRVFVDQGSIDFTNTVSGDTYVVVQGMESIASVTGELSQPRELTAEEKAGVIAGWEAGLAAEHYMEPEGDNKNDAGDVTRQETGEIIQQQATGENASTENEMSRI